MIVYEQFIRCFFIIEFSRVSLFLILTIFDNYFFQSLSIVYIITTCAVYEWNGE